MKKIVFTLILLMTTALVWAGKPAKVQNLINQYRHHDGFETVSFGPLGMSLMRTFALSDNDLDEEDRAALHAFDKIRRICILDFEDAQEEVKARFVSKVRRVLDGMELILEAKDEGSRLSIYGEDRNGKLKDCILFDPDGTLICVSGSVNMEKLMSLAND